MKHLLDAPHDRLLALFPSLLTKESHKQEYFFSGKPLQPSLMFAGKAGAPFGCST